MNIVQNRSVKVPIVHDLDKLKNKDSIASNRVRKESHSPGKNLAQYLHEFREVAEPLTYMLENCMARLEYADDKSRPYILSDIQNLSDGIVNMEALFGALIGDYCDLGDKCIFLKNQWAGASHAMVLLRDALRKTSVEAWEMRNQIDGQKKYPSCQ